MSQPFKLQLLFWLRRSSKLADGACPINLRIHVFPHVPGANLRSEIQTPFSVLPIQWNNQAKRVVGREPAALETNLGLLELEQLVTHAFESVVKRNLQPTARLVHDEYKGLIEIRQDVPHTKLARPLVYYPTPVLKAERERLDEVVKLQQKWKTKNPALLQFMTKLDNTIVNRLDA